MCFFIAIISVVLLAGCAEEYFDGDYAPVASNNGQKESAIDDEENGREEGSIRNDENTEQPTFCKCNICEELSLNQGNQNFIGHPLGASDGKISHNSRSCSDLKLIKRAIELFVDLNYNFDDSIKQIEFGYSPYAEEWINYNGGISIEGYISSVFKNDLWAILNANIYHGKGEEFKSTLFIINLYISFEQWERADGICVEFVKIDDEWVVNNLYSDIIMQ
jgi:hypothetical protein